jgi:nicotinamidase-related amidase
MPPTETLTPDLSLVLVIDVQERFMPAIRDADRVVMRTARLAKAARLLDVPVVLSEQVPDKLGATVAEVAEAVGEIPRHTKTAFSCCGDDQIMDALASFGRRRVIIAGIEAHVCVQQTAMDLLRRTPELTPVVCLDAISSRFIEDKQPAVARMRQAGVDITTTEAVLFEWMRTAEHPQFRAVQKLVK